MTSKTPGAAAAPNPQHADQPDQYLSHRQILIVLGGIMAGMLLAALDQSIVGTALPRVVSDLGGLDKLSWVVTAYLLTSTAATPLWGKISDLYGRRLIFQMAIGIFIVGSVLCGAAQNMTELISFRAFQGIGGGGLMSIAFAIIGDVIPPRERGRYQGYFGAVFGLSSVAGPLLGGWFTDGPGWRWIFYVNVPVGIAALVITSMALKMPAVRREHRIDYLGAAVIVGAVSSLLLYLNWAGITYGWTAPGSLALVGTTLVLSVVFVFVELRAVEPIIPMRLFGNAVFRVGNLYGFLAGMAMFGGIIFLPLYMQAVLGYSPTQSGLALLPAVVGIFATSISSGQMITRTGRYKIYPIIGAAILIVALLAMSTLGTDTSFWTLALFEFAFGAGLGLTMQTIVTAVQNSVEFRDMGVATSSTTFFRQMGASIGVAVFGAVLSSQLADHIATQFAHAPGLAKQAGPGVSVNANNVEAIQHMAAPVKALVLKAFAASLDNVFLVGVPIVGIALITALFLKEIPLRSRTDGPAGAGGPGAAPTGDQPVLADAH